MKNPTLNIISQIPSLRRYALALLGQRSGADDLVQDTLERALLRQDQWRGDGDHDKGMRPWLFAIMRNRYYDLLRQEKADVPLHDIEHCCPVVPPQWERMKLNDLMKALQQLSLEQREVLLLVGLENLSYRDAATVLGIPLGTVMSRLSRAREALRFVLDGKAVEE